MLAPHLYHNSFLIKHTWLFFSKKCAYLYSLNKEKTPFFFWQSLFYMVNQHKLCSQIKSLLPEGWHLSWSKYHYNLTRKCGFLKIVWPTLSHLIKVQEPQWFCLFSRGGTVVICSEVQHPRAILRVCMWPLVIFAIAFVCPICLTSIAIFPPGVVTFPMNSQD